MAATYINGHQESVLRSHKWRTAENSAAYLLPHIKPGMRILDVGCGPGTISIDFATRVPQGHVIGLENSPEVLVEARATAAKGGVANIEFVVLQHISDPVGALREMKRATKPGGLVATREGDFNSMTWFPENDALVEWRELHMRVGRALGGEPNAGRRLVSWAIQAGFARKDITASSTSYCYSDPEDRAWWSVMWQDRILGSSFPERVLDGGHATQADLERMAQAWRKWGEQEDGWFAFLHGEVLCRV
ncbi:S-adenosyl-L-methionine-dependent methyltransferase [Fomitopsis serialis]|uniref:S-adenosyl-L-methionine-dependent methyltransferase n=1 Tax=Fomitopsis serialis TaxID=139415 RepID=UPI002007B7C8|nr:S-adenosyl-L-methionine-dependent methyltransferase [Neoantrodia serialis]KAH9930622.1 S-adenosyl-L-methionine-dependent methyltransferase [Neoantrodia serialis]